MPNVFSPNSDGVNDVFGPLGIDISIIKILIFDRWGNLLFTGDNDNRDWDGTTNGASPVQ